MFFVLALSAALATEAARHESTSWMSQEVEPPSRAGLHIVKLGGFQNVLLNAEYWENNAPEFRVDGLNTLWSSSGQNFMYYCKSSKRWFVVGSGSFERMVNGSCVGLAHSPPVAYNGGSLKAVPGWKEYSDTQWHHRPDAGPQQVSLSCGVHEVDDCKGHCVWNDAKGLCTARWNIFTDIVLDDIHQGSLGSCYFLAALAAMAFHRPEVLERMFIHEERWQGAHPVYTTEWLLDGGLTQVAVDDMVPVNRQGVPAFTKFSDFHEFWPVVLEKAWAKIFGNFHAIEKGLPSEALKSLSQAPVSVTRHRGENVSAEVRLELWRAVREATEQQFPMLSVTGNTSKFCIAKGHAYVLIEAKEIEVNGALRKTLLIYNPWHRDRYCGELSCHSSQFRPHGYFWVTLEEYVEAFSYTTVASVLRGYSASSSEILTSGMQTTSSVGFQMTGNQSFSIMLSWPTRRLFEKSGCKRLRPSVAMAVMELEKDVQGKDAWGRKRCLKWVREKPTRCAVSNYLANCSATCSSVTIASRTDAQRFLGMSNIRADLPGGAGEYQAYVQVIFHSAHGLLLEKVALVAYAAEHVEFKQPQPSLLEISPTNATAPGDCMKLVTRLESLNNWEDIKATGVDNMFPASVSSVAGPGAICGDSAQGLADDCAKYNHWRSFAQIMAGRAGGAQKLINMNH